MPLAVVRPARAADEPAQGEPAGDKPAGGDKAVGDDKAAGDDTADAKPAAGNALRVTKLQFRGNRKVEDDAIKVNLKTLPGVTLTQEMVREDVRAIWKMGFFEDVQVEVADSKAKGTEAGSIVTFVLKEKPSIAKIYVAGNEEVALTKINEVLDIKKEQILDLAKLKKNVQKIKDLYVEKGFYMAEVTYEVKRATSSRSRSGSGFTRTRRSKCGG